MPFLSHPPQVQYCFPLCAVLRGPLTTGPPSRFFPSDTPSPRRSYFLVPPQKAQTGSVRLSQAWECSLRAGAFASTSSVRPSPPRILAEMAHLRPPPPFPSTRSPTLLLRLFGPFLPIFDYPSRGTILTSSTALPMHLVLSVLEVSASAVWKPKRRFSPQPVSSQRLASPETGPLFCDNTYRRPSPSGNLRRVS